MADKFDSVSIGPKSGVGESISTRWKDMGDGTFAPVVATTAASDSSGSSLDRDFVTVFFIVKTAFTGASLGDTISQTRAYDMTGDVPVLLATMWRNESTATDFVTVPSVSNLTVAGTPGLTDGQLRASDVQVNDDVLQSYIGALNVATPATDADDASLNARMKRLLITTTALSAKLPAALGSQASGSSLSVVPATTSVFTVAGNTALGVAISGNPLRAGATCRTTAGTYTDGQTTELITTTRSELIVSLGNQGTIVNTSNWGNDAVSTSQTSINVRSQTMVYNGTSEDRAKKANLSTRLPTSAATTNATLSRAVACDLQAIVGGQNTTSSTVYLHLYNKVTAPVPGTDTPFLTIAIPAGLTAGQVAPNMGSNGGSYYSLGFGFSLSTDVAGTTAVTAGAVVGLNFLTT